MNNENRVGNYTETFTGNKFWALDPRVDEVSLNDISHALSYICRFNGHSKFYYSVAQHSINVYKAMVIDGITDKTLLLHALLHDASEAYICDMPRPIKLSMPEYNKIEKNIEKVILEALEIKEISDKDKEIVKKYDDLLLNIEARVLMNNWREWCEDNFDEEQYSKIRIEEMNSAIIQTEFKSIFTKLKEYK